MNLQYPSRKSARLPEFEYTAGGYFVTVCTQDRKNILSRVVNQSDPTLVGRGSEVTADVTLSEIGVIANDQLVGLEERYPNIKIDKYVIMPNHIHILLRIEQETAGASPRPTLSDVICSFNSLTTRLAGKGRIFQTSFYDHIIRDMNDYLALWQYIDENPAKWELDEYCNNL